MLNYCYNIWNRKSSSTSIERTHEDERKIFSKKKPTLLTVASLSLLVITVARSHRMMGHIENECFYIAWSDNEQ